METKAEYVTDFQPEIDALIRDIVIAEKKPRSCHPTMQDANFREVQRAKAALREYVDALVKGGITAQIADLLEQVAALEIVIDAKEQTIAAMQARIDALESDLRELQE